MSSSIADVHDHGHGHEHGHEHGHAHPKEQQHHFATMEQQFDTAKIGMWLFLATEILLFGVLFVGFGLSQSRFPQEFQQAHHHLDRVMGALNTVVLLISSWTMVMAVDSASKSKKSRTTMFLLATFACACIFMVVKYFEYEHKFHDGLLPGRWFTHLPPTDQFFKGNSVFFSFYFMMTGLHGIHILVGMILIAWLLIRNSKGDFHAGYYTPVDLFGLYWHIVDMIWIYLFPLYYLIQ